MASAQFRLPIGAKRQVTMPLGFMEMLDLHQGSELLLEVNGDHATLTPMVSVPRIELPAELLKEIKQRMGAKPTDIPLADFLQIMRSRRAAKAIDASPTAKVTRRSAPRVKTSSSTSGQTKSR